MSAFLLDTHAWAWSLTGDQRLSKTAIELMEKADDIFISPVSLYEIGQKVRLGKWPEMAPFADRLPALLQEQGGRVAAVTPGVCLHAAMLNWGHRDPFDRLLAATAIANQVAIISVDAVFDGLVGVGGWIARAW